MSSIAMKTGQWAGMLMGAGLAFAVTSSSCVFEGSADVGPAPAPIPPPPGPPPTASAGSVTFRWTVDETTDPNTCIMGNAAALDVVLTTAGGQFAGEFQSACTNFATTIAPLVPGNYEGRAQLIDGYGNPRTTIVTILSFSITDGTTLVIDLDFPASSFL
jgi:hypothetical protein